MPYPGKLLERLGAVRCGLGLETRRFPEANHKSAMSSMITLPSAGKYSIQLNYQR